MKKLTLISILLTAVALVAVGCTSQDSVTPTESTQTLPPVAAAEPATSQPAPQDRIAIESAEPAVPSNIEPVQAAPESGLNTPPAATVE